LPLFKKLSEHQAIASTTVHQNASQDDVLRLVGFTALHADVYGHWVRHRVIEGLVMKLGRL